MRKWLKRSTHVVFICHDTCHDSNSDSSNLAILAQTLLFDKIDIIDARCWTRKAPTAQGIAVVSKRREALIKPQLAQLARLENFEQGHPGHMNR